MLLKCLNDTSCYAAVMSCLSQMILILLEPHSCYSDQIYG